MLFWYTVASKESRERESCPSMPTSISRCRSGFRVAEPVVAPTTSPGSPPILFVAVSGVNFCP